MKIYSGKKITGNELSLINIEKTQKIEIKKKCFFFFFYFCFIKFHEIINSKIENIVG